MSKEKIYLGKSESKETEYGKMHKVSFGPQDFEKMEKFKNQKGWLNCNIKESREGNLYLEIDTWKPKPQMSKGQVNKESDVPF
tara:strand:- start:871 stop:1119 length:249 start_codon:yes stop_codon:yes gene_type:complete